jgi:hypothetical protein
MDPFSQAVQAIITGDERGLTGLLRAHPALIRERAPSQHQATLLHYVAANGVENELQRSPKNAPAIAQILLEAGAEGLPRNVPPASANRAKASMGVVAGGSLLRSSAGRSSR